MPRHADEEEPIADDYEALAVRDPDEVVDRAAGLLKEIGLKGIDVKVRKLLAATDDNPTGARTGDAAGCAAVSLGDDEYIVQWAATPETFEDSAWELYATSESAEEPDELVGEYVTFEAALTSATSHIVKDRLWAATH